MKFYNRHIGINSNEEELMLRTIGVSSIDELIKKTIPEIILNNKELSLSEALSEQELLQEMKSLALQNKVYKSYIGRGYYGTITPSVILRNMFENPGWYTQYTPYQAEISQGRLESLLNFQTMIIGLTKLPISNASLLDEGTAAAEAMRMLFSLKNKQTDDIQYPRFFIDKMLFEQTKQVILTRANSLGIEVVEGDYKTIVLDDSFFGAIIQYPNSDGNIENYTEFIQQSHEKNIKTIMACDIMSLALLIPPGEMGADIAVGSVQRFGLPMGFGGPHAGYISCTEELKRFMPGRIIGVSVDAHGNRALRMSIQTREQHIKREKATSNICTAQALLANMAAMYAVYHGEQGIKKIALKIASLTSLLAQHIQHKAKILNQHYFDTLKIELQNKEETLKQADKLHLNFFDYKDTPCIGISIDETTSLQDIKELIKLITGDPIKLSYQEKQEIFNSRTSAYLTEKVFNTYHSETLMMRYLKTLEDKDLALDTSMISLGSCTMKLNPVTAMLPLSWSHFSDIHPFIPSSQSKGYKKIFDELEKLLCEITGFDACSLQPNSGANGEYAGLLTIRAYHASKKQSYRDIMLIPISAHGTNPASAIMAGYKVVNIQCSENGNINIQDIQQKITEYGKRIAGIMITYPSTYGVFEEQIKDICELIHQYGGQVYMDGANMNAQVGFTSPAFIGADVCHLNLHKTFAIPHGGGGPGVGPICVKKHLSKFLPTQIYSGKRKPISLAVASAPYGSALVSLISYAYIRMMGTEGLRQATSIAILNANYMKTLLAPHYHILYTGEQGMCAHEFIVDLRPFKNLGIEAQDVAKRLIDYGFHAPTLSFPVPGTIMIEPTESEDLAELDRFCNALIAIREEIRKIEQGIFDKVDNVLKNAPHTQIELISNEWKHAYTREEAAYPLPYLRERKFWASVKRVDNAYGDRNFCCTL